MPTSARLLRLVLLPLLGAFAFAPSTRGDSALRLTDLEPGGGDGLDGLDAAVLGDALYFVGQSASGPALYRYDGVTAPVPIAGSAAARPQELVAWNDRLYFQGGPSDDRELWSYDPAGPSIDEALDLRVDGNGLPQRFAVAGGELCFAAYTGAPGFELVCWDGVAPPQIFDLVAGPDSSFPEHLAAWAGGLAFTASIEGQTRLFVHDGVSAPEEITPGPGEPFSGPGGYAAFEDELLFEALDGGSVARLYRFDGASPPLRDSTTFSPYGLPAVFRGRLFLDGIDPALGLDTSEILLRLPAGYARVSPGVEIVGATGHATAAAALYFVAYPDEEGNDADLYVHSGCGPVAPATSAFAGAAVTVTGERLVAFGGRVYVAASDTNFGAELWEVTPTHLFCDDFESANLAAWL